MLIIDRKIVILHIRKAGGTSFCRGLIDLLPPSRIEYYGYTKPGEVRSRNSARNGGLWKHSKAADFFAKSPLKRDEVKVYLVSTRPYLERVASFYLFARRRNEKDSTAYPWVRGLSFSGYLHSNHLNRDTLMNYALSADGHLLVDHFVQYDRLDQEFSDLCELLGLGPRQIPRLNLNNVPREDYAAMYSPEDLTFIEEITRQEAALLSDAAETAGS